MSATVPASAEPPALPDETYTGPELAPVEKPDRRLTPPDAPAAFPDANSALPESDDAPVAFPLPKATPPEFVAAAVCAALFHVPLVDERNEGLVTPTDRLADAADTAPEADTDVAETEVVDVSALHVTAPEADTDAAEMEVVDVSALHVIAPEADTDPAATVVVVRASIEPEGATTALPAFRVSQSMSLLAARVTQTMPAEAVTDAAVREVVDVSTLHAIAPEAVTDVAVTDVVDVSVLHVIASEAERFTKAQVPPKFAEAAPLRLTSLSGIARCVASSMVWTVG
jgi:hypothetical protein